MSYGVGDRRLRQRTRVEHRVRSGAANALSFLGKPFARRDLLPGALLMTEEDTQDGLVQA